MTNAIFEAAEAVNAILEEDPANNGKKWRERLADALEYFADVVSDGTVPAADIGNNRNTLMLANANVVNATIDPGELRSGALLTPQELNAVVTATIADIPDDEVEVAGIIISPRFATRLAIYDSVESVYVTYINIENETGIRTLYRAE